MYTLQYMKQKMQEIKTTIATKSKGFWKNHPKKIIFGTIFIILIFIIVGKKSDHNNELIYVAQSQNVVDQIVLSGRTEPVNFVDLGFADSGRVQKVFVTEGQIVKKGQVLAELEMSDLQAQLLNARAGLTIAKANARQSESSLEKVTNEQDLIVQSAKRILFGNLEAYPDDIFSSAKAPIVTGSYQGDSEGEYLLEIYPSYADTGVSIRYSGLEEGLASVTVGSRVPLGKKGLYIQFPEIGGYANTKWIVPVPNNRSGSYPVSLANYQTALATRNRVIESAQSETSGEMQSIAQARVNQAQAGVDQIISAMNRRRIIAPFSGTISQVVLKQGESTIGMSKDISPGISLLAVDQYKVMVKIPEIDVYRIATGSGVSVTLDAYGSDVVFDGVLTTINPAETIVDGVSVYEGTIIFNKSDDRIRSGMTAIVNVVVNEKDDVVAIPREYLIQEKGDYFVMIKNEDDVIKKKVTIGITGSNGVVEITEGLIVDQVIVSPIKK